MKDSVVKRAKNVWGFIKLYITKYYVAFFVGGAAWMLLDVYVTKGIDASFVSAVMDFALVLFAILAFYQARKIWVDRAKQDGYKIALDLLNDKLIKAWASISDIYLFLKITKISHNKIKNELSKKNDLGKFIKSIDELEEVLKIQIEYFDKELEKVISPLKDDVKYSLFRMRNLSVKFSKNDKGTLLNEYFNDYLNVHNMILKYNGSLFELSCALKKDNDDDTRFISITLENIDLILKESDNLITLMTKLKHNHSIVIGNEHSVLLDYFDFK